MPTHIDDFSERAHANYMGAPEEAVQNRKFLKALMEKHGFVGLDTEWWHFDFEGWQEYPPIDVDVKTYLKTYGIAGRTLR